MPRAGVIPHAAMSGICSWAAQGMPPSEPKQSHTTAVDASSVSPDLQGIELLRRGNCQQETTVHPAPEFRFPSRMNWQLTRAGLHTVR